VAIDDTDSLKSRGTGWLSARLGEEICARFDAELQGITRHQLLVHPDVAYTSQNSAVCLDILFADPSLDDLFDYASEFLRGRSASGSNPGLCIAFADRVDDELTVFGRAVQKEVVAKADALRLAEKNGVYLRELGGTGGGVIGALSAVGLRATGNEGRYIRSKGIRDMLGVMTVEDVLTRSGVERIVDTSGKDLPKEDLIKTYDWLRPRLHQDQAVVFVERADGDASKPWIPVDRREKPKMLSRKWLKWQYRKWR
jgi:hypothetical protein